MFLGPRARVSGRDPDPELSGPDGEQEWRIEVDRLAVDAGMDLSGAVDLELRCRPPPSQARFGGGPVEDDDAESAAVEGRTGAGSTRRLEGVGVVRDEHDGGIWWARPKSSKSSSPNAGALGPSTSAAVCATRY